MQGEANAWNIQKEESQSKEENIPKEKKMQKEEWQKKLLGKGSKHNFLVILLLGVLLLVIAWPAEKTEQSKSQSGQLDSESVMLDIQTNSNSSLPSQQSFSGDGEELFTYAGYLEKELEELLGTMEGVGKVRVMVTLEDMGEAVVEKDTVSQRKGTTEVDAAGGSRNTTDISTTEETILQGGSGSGGSPYIRKVSAPRISGVAVSAQGGGNPTTANNIMEAIQALFGIEAHKIKIVKMISQ